MLKIVLSVFHVTFVLFCQTTSHLLPAKVFSLQEKTEIQFLEWLRSSCVLVHSREWTAIEGLGNNLTDISNFERSDAPRQG